MWRITARTEDLGRFLSRRPRVTTGLMGLLVAVYVLQRLLGGTGFEGDAAEVMARMGANVRPLVQQGQWWRLFTANFLHGFTLHIVMNGLALLSLGQIVERIVGPSRFLLIYLVSAVGGSIASSLWAGGALSLGASTAVFGLLGSFAMLSLGHRHHLPAGIGQSLRWWVIILGLNFSIPLFVPIVDGWAHVGGFVAGIAVTAAVYPLQGRLQFSLPESIGIKVALALVVGVNVYAGARAAHETATVESYPGLVAELARQQEELRKEADGPGLEEAVTLAGPEALNNQAWLTITSSSATREELERALDRAELANSQKPGQDTILDTLATARYRNGDMQGAVSAELQSLDAMHNQPQWRRTLTKVVLALSERTDNRNFHGSQLLRFSRALNSPRAVTLYTVIPSETSINVTGPPGRVWFAVERGTETLGLVQGYLQSDSLKIEAEDALSEAMNEGPIELVVLGSTTAAGPFESAPKSWEFLPWDPAVDDLP